MTVARKTITRKQEMQRLIRVYKDQTGESEVDMQKVAEFAVGLGWPLPKPISSLALLKKQFSAAAREEIRHDQVTRKPYRANHAIPIKQGPVQLYLWIDIDEAPRPQMLKSLVNRREQMVDDGLQLTLDEDHWNRIHPDEEPINLPMDLTMDIEWRRNTPQDGEETD
jgi:hypothetical protein